MGSDGHRNDRQRFQAPAVELTFRSIQKLLQSRAQFSRQSIHPVLVDQANVDEVANMRPILIAKRRQLHAQQGLKIESSNR